jgi:hypothetical protein
MTGELSCPHCGTRNPQGAFFCNRCGATLTGEGDRPAEDPAAPISPFDEFAVDRQPGLPGRSQGGESAQNPAQMDESAAESGGELIEPTSEFDPTIEALLAQFPERQPEEEQASQNPATSLAPEGDVSDLLRFPDEQLLGAFQPGQGYLESVTISGDLVPPALRQGRGATGDADHWRAVRALVREEPVLATASGQPGVAPLNWRKSWVFLLVLAAALLPFILWGGTTMGAPQAWTGVAEAYAAIERLALNDEVLVFWQVDPATAGEVNLAALPVVSHTLEQGARSLVVTLLPVGLGSARRLYDDAVAGLDESAMVTVMQGWIGDGSFLAGGTAALPFVAQNADNLFDDSLNRQTNPRLAVVFASRADDVQQWLEIVQPVNGLPVVAVTSAAADAVLRPYLESGQLVGLVSGFDGAATYQSLRAVPLPAEDSRRLAMAVDAQTWGGLLLILLAVVAAIASIAHGAAKRERHG